MPAGRPTKYDPKYCDEIIEYFDVEYTKIVGDCLVANDLPTFQRYAVEIGVHTDTLQEWKKVHPEFSVAYKKAKALQEAMWLSNSLKGYYPGAFTIFAGKNMFGWRDKRETEHSGSIGIDPATALINAIKGRKKERGLDKKGKK